MSKIILTGFMATGKSAVARAVARKLGWPHIDCDSEIIVRAGCSIPQLFRTCGEAHFRALEREVIVALAADRRRCAHCNRPRPAVIATGGGVLVDPRNFELLRRIGEIVCLTARPEIIARRVGASARSRPMLTNSAKPLAERIAELLDARREAYGRASISIDTSDLTIDQVVDSILTAVTERRWQACHLSA
jgi:shikimate kinase